MSSGRRNTGFHCAKPWRRSLKKSDVPVVLLPDNPEMHEKLCGVPLRSGKYVYIDKNFAPTRDAAVRMFEKADAFGTKCWLSSAPGFSSELDRIDASGIDAIYSEGPGEFEMYIIHQIEPVIRLMGSAAKRAVYTGTDAHLEWIGIEKQKQK